jgi:putative flavoprotein involved in K+ transport
MIQRSPTVVARSESLMKFSWSRLYSEEAVRNGITTDIADLTVASTPYRLAPAWQSTIYTQIREHDAEFYEGLERAGFMCNLGDDGSGINTAYIRRGGGYYIDVGASQLIIDGKIALKSPVTVERIKAKSVVLSDGSELPADLIVYATGYGPMNDWVTILVSAQMSEKVGRCWGVGSHTKNDPGPWEGELRNMWKPTQQPGLWFHGGNLMQSRLYSQFLALQIKARLEGIPTPVHGLAPVHHRH